MSASDPTSQKAFSLKTRRPVEELVPEDEMLTAEDRAAAAKDAEAGDCTTRPRACKNCTCGRAELEKEAEAAGKDLPGPPPGGCGNCARGDAFRCAGCPYRGKPAWSATETGAVALNLTDDL